MARIGLLGGAFDPPHNGHLAVARAVLAARRLDRVDLLVSGTPPHKSGKGAVASAEDRAAMATLAVEGIAGLGVETCELRRPGKSFTIDTVRALLAAHPGNVYEFIIGADMAADLPNWRDVAELLRLVTFVPVARAGWKDAIPGKGLGREAAQKLRDAFVNVPTPDVSSTRIRAAVAAGESIAAMVPPAVEKFIHARGLYRA